MTGKSKVTNATGFLLSILTTACVLLVFAPAISSGQAIRLSAEQQLMLNQLPAEQRQKALMAIEQLNNQNSSSSPVSSATEELTPLPQPDELSPSEFLPVAQELRAGPNTQLIIDLDPRLDLSVEESLALEEDSALSLIRGSHFYELDAAGDLVLPGLSSISLLGMTAEQAEKRLGAEPALNAFYVAVSILEPAPTGTAALKPFGYDVFESTAFGIEPAMSGPVPPDYVLGPGDSVRVQLFGNINGIYEFEVTRDGILTLPEIGPVTVAGLPFSEFRKDLNNRVKEMLIGTQVSVTMGQLRNIRIFVLGDANRPGSYVVGSMATVSSALYRSGGISPVGSLRDVQLKRNGVVVSRIDLYDLLLNGDTSGDSRVQPGDVIFVAPIGPQVSVAGAVKRPAIYETRGSTSVADVFAMAGGLLPDAFSSGVRIERFEAGQGRTVISIDAGSVDGKQARVHPGDELTVPKVLPDFEGAVMLVGHVHRPGPYQWREGMRLSDLIQSPLDLQPGADSDYVLIRRENPVNRHVYAVSVNLSAALANPDLSENIALKPRDTVHVFSVAFGRQRVIQPFLDELKMQSRFGDPYGEVSITGQVRAPGTYPLESGMRVSHLIRAGGSMQEGAYAHDAELTRFAVIDGEYRAREIIDINLDAVLHGDPAADLELRAHDYLSISLVPDWNVKWSVTVEGEVRFPGEYQVIQGETLSQLLERAGGLTANAFPQGAIFLRESLKEREREQTSVLAARMEADLTAMSLETLDTTGSEAMQTGQSLLRQLRDADPVGRLVIDINQVRRRTNGDVSIIQEIELRDGDRLLVPVASQEVTVIGEAQQPTSHLYQPGLSRDDYIGLSGGLTRRADKKLIYVVRASGAVIASNQSRWFGRSGSVDIRQGDTIVVPLETDRIRPLTFWTNVTQILYQGAIAVAAVKTFNR